MGCPRVTQQLQGPARCPKPFRLIHLVSYAQEQSFFPHHKMPHDEVSAKATQSYKNNFLLLPFTPRIIQGLKVSQSVYGQHYACPVSVLCPTHMALSASLGHPYGDAGKEAQLPEAGCRTVHWHAVPTSLC